MGSDLFVTLAADVSVPAEDFEYIFTDHMT